MAGGIRMIAVIGPKRAFGPRRVTLSRIEQRTGFGVFQQVMRFRHGPEPRLGTGIVGMQVRVRGSHQFAVSLLDVGSGGGLGQAKGCIGVVAYLVLGATPGISNTEMRAGRFDVDQCRADALTWINDRYR